MKSRIRRLLLVFIVVVIVGFGMLNVIAYNQAYSLMHYSMDGTRTGKLEELSLGARVKVLFAGASIVRPVSNRAPAELARDCRILSIAGGSNVILSAWYCNTGGDKPLVILFHGYSAEKSSLLREAREFMALGTSVLLVDFRGSGSSSECYTTIGVREADDVATVFRYSRAHLPHSSIVLFGQSMGAAAILRAIKEDGIAPDAVIVEAVFDTMMNTVRNRFKILGIPSFPAAELLIFWGGWQWGFDGFSHNPAEYAKSLVCPSLFMHGDKDARATIADSRRVFDAAHGPKEHVEFKSAGHESYVALSPDKWRAAVGRILKTTGDRRGSRQ